MPPVPRRIPDPDGLAALDRWRNGASDRPTLATAVRWSLQHLAEEAPGATVEVRVPPFGVAQCVAGLQHRRGTPPNVVETDAATWLGLVVGELTWGEAVTSGRVHASGQRADLAHVLPLHD
ncbi:sterol carrier family protein [Aquipuribacter nitratireducens]|uniref:Sterol carrier family protein n=1 Tax=Aquipuribacter nitratireducens TaxID=650104 RepID=A0ABW0GPV4_9MICO